MIKKKKNKTKRRMVARPNVTVSKNYVDPSSRRVLDFVQHGINYKMKVINLFVTSCSIFSRKKVFFYFIMTMI